MRVYQLLGLLLINLGAWCIIHFSISISLLHVSKYIFSRQSRFAVVFKTYRWEKEGELWDRIFAVKSWKDKVPDGAALFNLGYEKQHLPSHQKSDIAEFSLETKRAELTHWGILLISPIFFLWNPNWAAWLNVLYGCIANIPFILIQRYNRPRLERIRRTKEKRKRL